MHGFLFRARSCVRGTPTPDEPSHWMILLEEERMIHSSLTIAVLTIRQIRRRLRRPTSERRNR